MSKDKRLTATFQKKARVVSDYENDMIFEQPRENLFMQEFISYEQSEFGCKRTTIKRKFDKNGGYNDMTTTEII
tara:strand:+ start:984 stop:1205 length:222 start_codon:yes stop_codon:yes gene_type:complete